MQRTFAKLAGLSILFGMASISPAMVVNVDFNGNGGSTETGLNAVFPIADDANFNGFSGNNPSGPLSNSQGLSSGLTLSGSAAYSDNSQKDDTHSGTSSFQDGLVTIGPGLGQGNDPSQAFASVTISGFAPNVGANLYLFGYFSDGSSYVKESTAFTINGVTKKTTGALSSTTGFTIEEDYVVFSNVVPLNGSITINFTDNNTRDVGVFNGFQLETVPLPEPATLGLLGLVATGMMAMARRKK